MDLPQIRVLCFRFLLRRGARAVEWDGLENRCGGNSTQGSNPCPSAIAFFACVEICKKKFSVKAAALLLDYEVVNCSTFYDSRNKTRGRKLLTNIPTLNYLKYT